MVGRLHKDAVQCLCYTDSREWRPEGAAESSTAASIRRDLARMACTTRWCTFLSRGANPQTMERVLLYSKLVPECIFRFHGVRFQIEFAFRDAKRHLGLNDSQARSQAKLHSYFNIVFAALF